METTQSILDWLIKQFPTAKRQTLKRMVQGGRVTVNGRKIATLKHPLIETDRVGVDEGPPSRPARPPNTLRIVYEDEDILVLDKPIGLLTSTVPREPRPTLWAIAKEFIQGREPTARVGLIHRLDRDASGLLVFSKNDGAYQSLKDQFFNHTVHREYTAIVHGIPKPPTGRIESQLIERADGTVYSTRQIGKGRIGVTEYTVIQTEGKKSLLKLVLQTGRKHQIRVHMSGRDCPIVGDKMYGRKDDPAHRLMLAATKLTILHPRDGKEMTFTIPTPKDFEMAVEK